MKLFRSISTATCFFLAAAGLLGARTAQGTLVGHYRLDESGTTTNTPNSAPAAPAGTDGTLQGYGFDADSGWRPGVAGNALEFDGVDDGVNTGDDGYDSFGQGTITAWINTADFSRRAIFASASDTVASHFFRFGVRDNDAMNRISVGGQFGTSAEIMSNTTDMMANTWHHVATTSDGSEWKLYIDGIEQDTIVLAGANDGTWFNYVGSGAETNSYSIGFLDRSTGDVDFYDGLIDDVQIYDMALSGSDINLLRQFPGLSLEEARIAVIPEPASGLLAALAGGGVAMHRGRRKRRLFR